MYRYVLMVGTGNDGLCVLPITATDEGATTYAYDANGNQTNKGVAATFTWNGLNQLTSASQNGLTTTNVYNGDGFRMSRHDSDDQSTSTYTWDVAGNGQVLDDGDSQFVYGALGLYAHVTGTQTYYYLTDGLGSVLAEVKSDGTNAVSYQYDVYGNIVNQSGSLYDERQFAGEQADPTGLTYLRARFYDATMGRFLSRDPCPHCIFDPAENHPYMYAGDNPASAADPSGRDLVFEIGGDDEQGRNPSPADAPTVDTSGALSKGGPEQTGIATFGLSDSAGAGLTIGMEVPEAISADAQQAAMAMTITTAAAPEQARNGSPNAAGARSYAAVPTSVPSRLKCWI